MTSESSHELRPADDDVRFADALDAYVTALQSDAPPEEVQRLRDILAEYPGHESLLECLASLEQFRACVRSNAHCRVA